MSTSGQEILKFAEELYGSNGVANDRLAPGFGIRGGNSDGETGSYQDVEFRPGGQAMCDGERVAFRFSLWSCAV